MSIKGNIWDLGHMTQINTVKSQKLANGKVSYMGPFMAYPQFTILN